MSELVSEERMEELFDKAWDEDLGWGIDDPDVLKAKECFLVGAHAVLGKLEQQKADRPIIVCLCGSTRFKDAFVKAQFEETLVGKIVLTIGCDLRTDEELFGKLSLKKRAKIKRGLDELHLRKIDLADEVLILNAGGYIGESTSNELAYARKMGKRIRFLEPPEKEKPCR